MSGDGWKHLDLELPPTCTVCGKRVVRTVPFEYRYLLAEQKGQVRHIECIRKVDRRLTDGRAAV